MGSAMGLGVMQDEFVNRLDMFTRSLGVLDRPEHTSLWEDQPPLIFTTKVGEARTMTGALDEAQKQQEAATTGTTVEKEREETELEEEADLLGDALVLYFNDHGQETEAAEVDLTPTQWAKLRDRQLLAKAQLVIDRATALASGPTATEAAQYGITPAAVAALTKERKDYDDIINAPGVAIAVRKALTDGFRPAFNLVEKKFVELDKLIRQFAKTAEGKTMVASWKAARIIKDAGHGPRPAATVGTAPPPA